MILRVVADTNVYVSAIVFGGTCESILALAGAGLVDLFVSPAIQRELRSVLTHTFGWSRLQVREALAQVSTLAIVVRPATKVPGVLNYEPDHRILECALAARADFLVTGDKKHLQPLKSFRGVRIVSPREFLNYLRSGLQPES